MYIYIYILNMYIYIYTVNTYVYTTWIQIGLIGIYALCGVSIYFEMGMKQDPVTLLFTPN